MLDILLLKEKRTAALPTSPLIFMTTCNGFVPRDCYCLELRHHQMLFIVVIVLSSFVLIYGCKITCFLLICKLFCFFFIIL